MIVKGGEIEMIAAAILRRQSQSRRIRLKHTRATMVTLRSDNKGVRRTKDFKKRSRFGRTTPTLIRGKGAEN